MSHVKIYATDENGVKALVAAESIIVELSNGHKLEITWDKNSNDPRPEGIAIWGGSCPREDWDDAMARNSTVPLIVMPSAANVVLVSPLQMKA